MYVNNILVEILIKCDPFEEKCDILYRLYDCNKLKKITSIYARLILEKSTCKLDIV